MPYLPSLATRSATGTSYFASTHLSIAHYFMLTAGDTITNDDDFDGVVDQDNIARSLPAAGPR